MDQQWQRWKLSNVCVIVMFMCTYLPIFAVTMYVCVLLQDCFIHLANTCMLLQLFQIFAIGH